jgi:hypothetical protein
MRSRSTALLLSLVLACGLVVAGCGDGDSGSIGDITDIAVPQNAQDALDQARQAIEDAPTALEKCIDEIESSNLPSDQADSLRQLCESGADAANALGNSGG